MTTITALYTQYYGKVGLPLHHLAHDGGQTRAAILSYVRYMADPIMETEPTIDEMRLICEYCAYFVNAPCWVGYREELRLLRASIEHIKQPHELASWLWGAAQIGIEPL